MNKIHSITNHPSNTNLRSDFSTFSLSTDILTSLSLLGYLSPTPIQSLVIPQVLEGRDIFAKAQTGTGKTAAFGIPLCELVSWEEFYPQALILEPTRELADQVQRELFHLGRLKRLKIPSLIGGLVIDQQIRTLKQKNHMVVGTPGRVMDHVRRKTLDLSKIKYLVIDEADLMFEMGFFEEVMDIVQKTPANRQTLLFSATLNAPIKHLVSQHMNQPIDLGIEEETTTVSTIEERIYLVLGEEKYDSFLQSLASENPQSAMIFCATKEMVNTLYQKLQRKQIRCLMLHGDLEQRQRLSAIDGFREGAAYYLICTDVAARGIDFPQVTHVFHYDFPTGKETYVHRTGRTGRNGKSGISISFVTPEEEYYLKKTQEFLGKTLIAYPLEKASVQAQKDFQLRQKTRPVRLDRKGVEFEASISRLSIGGGKKSKIRALDIVGTICSIDGINAQDIGIIDVRESISFVDIQNNKGKKVHDALQQKTIKGKVRKVKFTSSHRL